MSGHMQECVSGWCQGQLLDTGPGWAIPWDHADGSAVIFKETPAGEAVTHGSLSYGECERGEIEILRGGRE